MDGLYLLCKPLGKGWDKSWHKFSTSIISFVAPLKHLVCHFQLYWGWGVGERAKARERTLQKNKN